MVHSSTQLAIAMIVLTAVASDPPCGNELPMASPESVGLDASRLQRVET